MKLIILYGAPAAGKLTVAQELARIADVHVFDNHQVIDMVEPIVTRKYADFAKLIYDTQRNIIDAAVKADQTNVVLTFPYASTLEHDIEFITNVTASARKQGAEVYPVLLVCDEDTLRKRATEPSRKAYGKITTVELMNTMIAMHEFKTPPQVEGNTVIDTDETSAADAALQIKDLAGL